MRRDFFPDREWEMLSFSRTLSSRLQGTAGHLGIPPATVEAFAQATAAFSELYTLSVSPSTRTPVVTQRKRTARKEMERLARMIARQLGPRMLTDDATRRSLGLNVPAARRKHVGPPTSAPLVRVRGVDGSTVHIELRDAERSHSRARPDNAQGAMIFYSLHERPTEDASNWNFALATTSRRVSLMFDPSLPPGTQVFISAWWRNRRYERGPACEAVDAYLGKGVHLGEGGVRVGDWAGAPTAPDAPQEPGEPAELAQAA